MQQTQFQAMGCTFTVVVDSDSPTATAALRWARKRFTRLEDKLSRFRPHSDLNALNRRAGQGSTRIGHTLWQALQHAIRLAELSNGLVTPTVGAALIAAGYDRDFQSLQPSESTDARIPTHSPVPDWRQIVCDARRRKVALPANMQLDLGGSAKGWAAAHLAQQLGRRFPTLVDAGGDIAISGPRRNGAPWPVAVADPRASDEDLELLMVRRGGIATSGVDYRRWQRHGSWQHHLIDPRTGAPAETNLLAVTVIAPTLALAELAAKVVLLVGEEEGLRWLAARPALAALLVNQSGAVLRTPTLARHQWQPHAITSPHTSVEDAAGDHENRQRISALALATGN